MYTKNSDINIPPIISVNQCTPDKNLLNTIIAINTNIAILKIFLGVCLNLICLFIIIDDKHTQIANIVCDDGNDASNPSSNITGR